MSKESARLTHTQAVEADMKIEIEITQEQLSNLEALGKDNDEGFVYVFGVGVATLVQRQASQAKQSDRNRRARLALKYVEQQGIKL